MSVGVPQYTTPTFVLTFTEPSLNLTQAANVYVTFQSGQNKFTKTGDALNVSEKTIGVHLSQRDTAKLNKCVDIQANWTDALGNRSASDVVNYKITQQLLTEVVQ